MLVVLVDIVLTVIVSAAFLISCAVLWPSFRGAPRRRANLEFTAAGPRPSAGSLTGMEQRLQDVAAGDMTDDELCRVWRLSHNLLGTCVEAGQRAELAALRQSYLDEFEQRHPAGFVRWLHDDPTSADDLHPYLTDSE